MTTVNSLKGILSHKLLRGILCLAWCVVVMLICMLTGLVSGNPQTSFKNQFQAIAQNPDAASMLAAAEILEMDMNQLDLDQDPHEGIQIAYASVIHTKAKAQAAKDVEYRNPTEYAARLTELRGYIAIAPFYLGPMLSYQLWIFAALIHLAVSLVVGVLVCFVIPWPKSWASYIDPSMATQL